MDVEEDCRPSWVGLTRLFHYINYYFDSFLIVFHLYIIDYQKLLWYTTYVTVTYIITCVVRQHGYGSGDEGWMLYHYYRV